MTTTNSVTPATLKLRVPAWAIVAIAVTTQVVLVMNTAIVTVALPGIHQAFGLSVDGQQWVINAYLVTFGGFLLFAARAGDLFGQKKVGGLWGFRTWPLVLTWVSMRLAGTR
jgi:MFS family permease